MTIGEYAWLLLSEHNYFGYILKRLPIPLVREWQVKYAERQLQKKIAEENEKFRDDLQVGTKVLALYSEDGKYYDAVISRVLNNGNFLITYSEYGNSEELDIGSLKLKEPVRKKSSKSRSRSRNRHSQSRSRGRVRRSRSRSPQRSSRRSRSRERSRRRSKEQDHRRRSRSRSAVADNKEVSREDLVKQILNKEKEKASASGKGDWVRRPPSYKQALSLKMSVGTARARSKTPPPDRSRRERDRDRDRERDREREERREPSPKKTQSAEQLAKIQKLKAIYGDVASSQEEAPAPARSKPQVMDATEVFRLGQK
jgi:hypothetical protein